jgi:hypothetical protein
MNRRFSRLFMPLWVVLLLLTACEFSASTANISNVTLARDEAGTQPTTSFEPDETFYLVVDLANAPDDTSVRTAWYAVDVGSVAAPNTLIDEISLESGSGKLYFNLAPSGLWAPGTYKADVLANSILTCSILTWPPAAYGRRVLIKLMFI